MGRTQKTYRMRLLAIRDRMLKLLGPRLKGEYEKLWVGAHTLSGPASVFPYSDTHAVITFSMIVDVLSKIIELETQISRNIEINPDPYSQY